MIQFGRTSLAELRVWSFEYISYLKQTIEYYWNGYWKYLETVFECYSVRRFYAWYLEQMSYDFIILRKYKWLVGYSTVYRSKALHTVSKRKKKEKAYFAKFSKSGNCLVNEVYRGQLYHISLFRTSFCNNLEKWSGSTWFFLDCNDSLKIGEMF